MPPRILIADPDQAFGLMLKQMLELNGDYQAEHVSTGALALASVRKHIPDLAIIDMAIRDVPPPLLISSIQQWAPQARVMLIPVGETVPDDIRTLPVQGILRKPFFIGDLGRQIARALGTHTKPLVHLPPPLEQADSQHKPRIRQIVQTPARPPAEPPGRSNSKQVGITQPPRAQDSALDEVLLALARELHADAVLVLRQGALLAQHGDFDGTRLDKIVERLLLWRTAADELMSVLGERAHFQRALLEGARYCLYTYYLNETLCLLTLCRSDLPLGTARLALRAAADRITKIVH